MAKGPNLGPVAKGPNLGLAAGGRGKHFDDEEEDGEEGPGGG